MTDSKASISKTSKTPNSAKTLVWLRRDLRWDDHAALAEASSFAERFVVAFVFDREILDQLDNKSDRRVEFIWEAIAALKAHLIACGGDLIICYAKAREAIPELARELGIERVICAKDYEPAALVRDHYVAQSLTSLGCDFIQVKDHVIFEGTQVLTQMGKPYSVFTPYKNAWLKKLSALDIAEQTVDFQFLAKPNAKWCTLPSLKSMGFETTNLKSLRIPIGQAGAQQLFDEFKDRMDAYSDTRNYPAVKGPSYLSVHLRFGTISIRQLVRQAHAHLQSSQSEGEGEGEGEGVRVWLSELIWRDFYFQIVTNFPHSATNSFKPDYDRIQWDQDQALFQAWCEARTGFPLIDAAMIQLNTTGYMHNRLRMVVASYLTKDLGIDWRWGERYFAQTLNDYDLSANVGGWQWAASSGCDAQPYFRIFNPTSQSEKFDADGLFIKRYLPQLAALSKKDIHAPWLASSIVLTGANVQLGKNYPLPIVEHDKARLKTLARYAVIKN
jgi:deoxyribodipyrimidine photo-lyase